MEDAAFVASRMLSFWCPSFLFLCLPSAPPPKPDLVQCFPWVDCWSQIPDGGHRSGSPHLSPFSWDGEFIWDVRPGQDLE